MSAFNSFDPFARENGRVWSSAAKWAVVCVGLIVVLAILFGILGLGFGWFNAGKDVISAENVKQQYALAYQDYESLKATAENVCDAENLAAKPANADVKSQHEQHVQAYVQNYRRVAAEYNAAYQNVFAAKNVGPSDLPRNAPSLAEAKKNYC
jgi:preprotein translocase subunit SecF